jgi:hypothetical protein
MEALMLQNGYCMNSHTSQGKKLDDTCSLPRQNKVRNVVAATTDYLHKYEALERENPSKVPLKELVCSNGIARNPCLVNELREMTARQSPSLSQC